MTGLLEFTIGITAAGAVYAWERSGHRARLPVVFLVVIVLSVVGPWAMSAWVLVSAARLVALLATTAGHLRRHAPGLLALACIACAVGIAGAAVYGITTS